MRTTLTLRCAAAGAALTIGLAACSSSAGPATGPASAPAGVHTGARIGSATQLVAETTPLRTANPTALAQVAAADQRLALALLKHLATGSDNVSVSPSSLYLALAMLQNGARGATADQIAAALQASGIDAASQNAGAAGLIADWGAAAKQAGITIDSANSIWQQRGFPVRPQFLTELTRYYDAGVWQVDFAHHMSDALHALNTWTSRSTHGKITKLFDALDPSTVMVLANAIYFHAAWATPFNPDQTEPGPFTTADGRSTSAKFMHGIVPGVATPDYEAVQLPYRGNRFAALAVMPRSGSLAAFVSSLTPARLTTIAAGLTGAKSVAIPKFTTTSTLNLVPTLQALGMHDAFGDNADFSGLSSTPTTVDQVIQRVYLGVGEKGTTAAAATGIAISAMGAAAGPQVVLDHPFLFLIRDTRTGAILFASAVQNPAA